MNIRTAFFVLLCVTAASCRAPRLAPLADGTPVRSSEPLPVIELPRHGQRIVFTWRLQEAELEVRGDGAARVAAPDSARIDLFVAGGLGNGAARVIGDDMRLDAPDALRRVLPPPAFLWAALGRFAIPPGRDTIVARTGSSLTADIGPSPRWRLSLQGRRITRLERAEGDRVVDRLERRADGSLVYFHAPTRRQLTLTITRVDSVAAFDASIWRP
ncbi:MAG TPA: hypothetical protein VE861_05585 [Gemmatimonadaceae bacterium]|nr:hypothetical protein [Gemmatimonadaceae bacterium]